MSFLFNPLIKLIFICSILVLHTGSIWGQVSYIDGQPKIAYWELGDDEETVIIIHGGPGVTHDYLRPEWDRLSQFSRIIYYDQRGSGLSDSSDCYSWKNHVSDLQRLIKTISNGKKVILAGTSWGTILVLLFVQSHPEEVKGLILSGTIPWPGKGLPKRDCSYYDFNENLASYFQKPVKKPAVNKNNSPQFLGKNEDQILKERLVSGLPEVRMETMKSLDEAPVLDSIRANMPAIIFQGADSCFYPDVSKAYLNIFSEGEIIYIDGSCHDPWLIHQEIFFEHCRKFVLKFK